MRRLSHLRAEDGIVLPLAMIVLIGLLALVALVVDSAITTNRQATTQINRRVALNAADAGLQAAVYRLSSQPWASGQAYSIPPTDCFGTQDDGAPPSSANGVCNVGAETKPTPTPGADTVTDSLGSMGSYTYNITPALAQATGPGCTGWWVNNGSLFGGVSQRCVTATGTYNGVTRRVQERIAAQSWIFPVNGILSLGEMKWDTSGSQYLALNGTFQSNGLMTIGSGAQTTPDNLTGANLQSYGGFSFGPGEACTAPACTKSVPATPFPHPAGPTATDYTNTWASNNDSALLSGTWAGTYSAATGKLTVSGKGTAATPLVLSAGTYIFCGVTITNSYITTSGRVTIYIDSPATNPGGHCGTPTMKAGAAGCPSLVSNAGGLTISGSEFYNPSGVPTDLNVFIYGNPAWTPACPLVKGNGGAVSLENVGNPSDGNGGHLLTASELYAPDSYITTTGAGVWWAGGIVAGGMESNDNDVWGFTPHPPTQMWFPTAWHTCSTTPSSSSDPGSGCY
jgi:Tfp pilus assembly protein PilX